MLIPHGALILVLDGSRSRLLRNSGTESAPSLHVIEERCNHGSGESGSATLEREREEARFGHDAQEGLWKQTEGKAPAILVAPPHLLGLLRRDRPRYAHPLAEIGKDWTKLPVSEIGAMLQQHR